MKTTKKTILVIIALIVALTAILAACGGEKDIAVIARTSGSGTRDAFESIVKSEDGTSLKDAGLMKGAIEQDKTIEGLIIIINTVGGDVEAGLAIAELISSMKTPTVSIVVGGGHSIGVPLAVSAKHSFIVKSATMTIHPVRLTGLVLGVPQTLSYFEKMQERIVRFVSDNSQISAERFKELMLRTGELVMDVGSVLTGEDAVEEGIIDSVGGLSDAIACLYRMIEEDGKCSTQ